MIHVSAPAPTGFVPACGAVPKSIPDGALWTAFRRHDLVLVTRDDGSLALPASPDAFGAAPVRVQSIGSLDGTPVFSAELARDATLPEGVRAENLRTATALVSAEVWAAAAYGFQVQYWDRTTQFCGECGARTVSRESERHRAKRCSACTHEYFPRIAPCTITLVHDARRVLLTRTPAFPKGRYGLVAGFVEPGETLEDCARREIREETGLEVSAVTYCGSQPWPFPHQLMVGFTARYATGEITLADGELEEARWFDLDALPQLPPHFSIARRMIDAFITASDPGALTPRRPVCA